MTLTTKGLWSAAQQTALDIEAARRGFPGCRVDVLGPDGEPLGEPEPVAEPPTFEERVEAEVRRRLAEQSLNSERGDTPQESPMSKVPVSDVRSKATVTTETSTYRPMNSDGSRQPVQKTTVSDYHEATSPRTPKENR